MTATSGKRLLSTSLLVSAGVLTLAELQRKDRTPSVEQYLGLAIAFFILSAAADLGADSFAGGFAMLLLITILLTRGEAALSYAIGRAGGQTKKIRRATNRTANQTAAAVGAGVAAAEPTAPVPLSPLHTRLGV